MALRDQPYFPLYVGDYLSDEKVKQCDPASEGIYIRMLCNMHKSESYGCIKISPFDKAKLKQNVSKIVANDDQKNMIASMGLEFKDVALMALKIANMIGRTNEQVFSALLDLMGNNVVQINGCAISQKRMVKDGEKSEVRAAAGRKGGCSKTNKTQAHTKQNTEYEDEYEDYLGKGVKGENLFTDWRKDYKTYLSQLSGALEQIKTDADFIAAQRKFYPGVDIALSLEKACENYWATEGAWERKKKSKTINIDWKATMRNALTIESNHVKTPNSHDPHKTVFS